MRQAFGDYDDRNDDFTLVGEEREDAYGAPPSDRRLATVALTMLVMALFAGGLWFAYHLGARHATGGSADVPLIRADRTPDKIKPAEPGGMQIPDQNVSIYDEKPGVSPIEKLLPAPEEPLPRPESLPSPEPPPAALAPPPVMAASPPVAPSGPAVAAHDSVAPPLAVASPEPAAAPTAPHRSGFGQIEVRLASVRTPDAARLEWARLKLENPDLLGRLHAFAVRGQQGDHATIYRIEAGPFADAAAAAHLCDQLRQRHRGCIVVR
jgi:hypothetical protein